jgi:competence protein ComEC
VQQIALASRVRDAFAAWVCAESGRFVLFLPVFMSAGVVAYFAWPDEPQAIPAALMAAMALPAGVVARARPVVQAGLFCAGFATLGFASAQRATRAALPWADLPRHAVLVSGAIAAIDPLPVGRRVTLAAPSLDGAAPLSRAVRIRLRDTDSTAFAAGDHLSVRALLLAPSPPAYPGGWDTQRDAYFAGMAGYGFALGSATLLSPAPGARWQHVREAIAARIMTALPGTRGAIAATMLTGMGAAIPDADRAAFQTSGLAHLLAVAGLHGGIVMGLVYAALRRGLTLSEHAALFWPVKPIAASAALLAGLGYLALTGAHVPILRSFAMAALVTLAVLTGRRAISLRALGLAALALMLGAPALTMGVSFQMSFCAMLALIAGWEVLRPHLAWRQKSGFWRRQALHVVALAVTSALAGTACLPVAAYHFGSATAYYVPANLLAVPVTALWIMPWGLAGLALMPLGLHGLALAPMGWGIGVVLWIARSVAAWPYAVVPLPQMPPAALMAAVAGLVWLCLWRTRLRLAGLAFMAAGLAAAIWAPRPDIVVSADARLIAARSGGQVYVSAASGVSRYDRQTPRRIWGAAAKELPAAGANCHDSACVLAIAGRTVTVQLSAQAPCPAAGVVVSHARATCPAALVVDRLSTRSQGATSIRFTPSGPVILTDAEIRGDRPWVLRDGTAAPRLPPALTE